MKSLYNRIRLDKIITIGNILKIITPINLSNDLEIPILMYHSICDEVERGHPYYWVNTSINLFHKQIKYIKDNGYQVISISQAVEMILENDRLAKTHLIQKRNGVGTKLNKKKSIVLTFDDGYHDFYTQAFPLIEDNGLTATLFVPTEYVGKINGLKGKEHLSWYEIRELERKRITIGSHTVNHLQLYPLNNTIIESELNRSKNEIEEKIGKIVDAFCYPYKFPTYDIKFTNKLQYILQKAGYKEGVSTRLGTKNNVNDLYFLRRIPINSGDDIDLFKRKLCGSYNWISWYQKFRKIPVTKS